MADAPAPPPKNALWTLIELLFVLLLVATVLERLPKVIEAKTGFNILEPRSSIVRMATINEGTPLGTVIRLTKNADLFSDAGIGRVVGFQRKGAKGTLSDGWRAGDTERWWYVDFGSGADGWVSESSLANATIDTVRRLLWTIFYIFSGAGILIGGGLVMYLIYRINGIRAAESRAMLAAIATARREAESFTEGRNPRWLSVIQNIESQNPNDWRQAILEADIMLDELVTRIGYRGESLGEKLKAVEPSDFMTIEQAWEAHKIRNLIAHAGSDFILTRREALRAIDLFRQVFEEFRII
jgi:hypothetical protein